MPKGAEVGASKKAVDGVDDAGNSTLALPRSGRDLGGGTGTTWPTLTRTNYNSWSLLMKVILQVRHMWDIIDTGVGEYDDDRIALEAILRAVPAEMIPMLAVKDTAKEAWDAITTIRVGADRVRDSKAQNFRKQYEDLRFKPGESVDDFGLRLQELVHQMDVHGAPVDDKKVILKYLRIVPKKYKQMARSIESLLDLKTMSIEELTGRLKVCEEDDEDEPVGVTSGGQLLLTEEQWRARMKGNDASSGSGGGGGNRRDKGRGRDGAHDKPRGGNGGTARDDECRYSGKLGHWARDCHKKKREEAHLAKEVQDDEPAALLTVQLCLTGDTPKQDDGHVFLNEERARVRIGDERDPIDVPWYLDSGASNHMTGSRDAFADLDTKITGSVRFGDNSIVDICGRGTVVIAVRGDEHRALTNVYFIPRLNTSIVSLGQLDENGCPSSIRDGFMSVWDRNHRLLARVPRSPNRLYKIKLQIVQPVCLSARQDDADWTWHEHLGHQSFGALRTMSRSGMVQGLPAIGHVDQLCDACLAGKQKRAPFPQVAKFRATARLELIHADLCGPISPATPGGKRYFLLMVDDYSRYMWLVLLSTKDEADAAIRRIKAAAEVQSGCVLCTLRTDRGGEFTSRSFDEFCADNGVQRHLTAPYTPQHNGVVERRNQTVVATARSMLKGRGVPSMFWGEAVTTAVYLLNRSFTRAADCKTP
jgi:hypothetical protein